YVLAANRVGHEGPTGGGIEFWGGSFICDPFGRIIAEAGRNGPEVLVAECDLVHLEQVRQHWPFLRDRRIDAYGPLTLRFGGKSAQGRQKGRWLPRASLCPPSGSRTLPLGSPGPIIVPIGRESLPRSLGCMPRSCGGSTSANAFAFWFRMR